MKTSGCAFGSQASGPLESSCASKRTPSLVASGVVQLSSLAMAAPASACHRSIAGHISDFMVNLLLWRSHVPHFLQLGAAGAKHFRYGTEPVKVALHLLHRRLVRAGDEVDGERHGREGHVHLLGERDAAAVELCLELYAERIDIHAVLLGHLVRDDVG